VLLQRYTGWPHGRGAVTITVAHITFAVAYATVVIQSRIANLDPALEEAAADLGAKPLAAFFSVVLPLIAPALAAAWLLSFSLSLDDFVITAFVTGPGATAADLFLGQIRGESGDQRLGNIDYWCRIDGRIDGNDLAAARTLEKARTNRSLAAAASFLL
jgi:ABC-type spermidine/putrescine transport system permease subunit II